MKIFNWMQKRLNPNVLKDGLARNVKKTDSIAIDSNSKALLEQVAFLDVLDSWKDGILTIGTFGFDPLTKLDLDQHKEYSASDSDEEAEEGEGYALNNDDDHENDDNSEEEEEEVTPLMFRMSQINCHDVALTPPAMSPEIKLDHLDDQGKFRRRTTLAELFLEDSDMKKKMNPNEFTLDTGKQASDKAKDGGIFFPKKLIPHARDDSRPVKRIQKMMKRMLKRKIHPDIEGKGSNSKSHCPNNPGLPDHAPESVSLLPTPDAAM
ncbi:hypothetical protein SLE2022_030420 [Rubroshorea leprosula]